MASSSLNTEGQKRMRVMSLDYLKNSLMRKPSSKTVCCRNGNLDHDHTFSDFNSEPMSVEFKSGSCKACGKAKLKSKSGLFKFLRKWLWGQSNLGGDNVDKCSVNNEGAADCANCSLPVMPIDVESKENLHCKDCVNGLSVSVSTPEGFEEPLNLDHDRGTSDCTESGNCLLNNITEHVNNNNHEVNSSLANSDINSAIDADVPVRESVPVNLTAERELLPSPIARSLTCELLKLSKFGWYWGPISREEAEEKLQDQPDGAFLVRDSSASNYLLSLSFRSSGKILHTRIEHSQGLFSFYNQPEQGGFATIEELIDHSVSLSQSAVFCYSRPRSPGHPAFPVRLTKPVSRFTQVKSLQYLCRFIIRQYVTIDNIESLPLPHILKKYIEESHY